MSFVIHRIYESPIPAGRRVLVDRLWPRGVKKSEAKLDLWLRDIAPSTELRRWYGHDPALFEEFAVRYLAELGRGTAEDDVAHLLGLAETDQVILITATKDVAHSGAQVLLDHLTSLQQA